MKREIAIASFVAVLFLAPNAFAGNFAECVLEKMPGSANEAITTAVMSTCSDENPGGYYNVIKGSGLGIFGFRDPNACTLKKAHDTPNQRGAVLIAYACRCLYSAPAFEDEPCMHRPKPQVIYQEPPPAPLPVAPAPTAPAPIIPPPPIRQKGPTAEEMKEAAKQRAYDAQVQADLLFMSKRVVEDYPYLDTPEGKAVLNKIINRRDELISRGVYPSIALTQAAADFAPANMPRHQQENKAKSPSEYSPVDKGGHPGFPSGCRWVTPQEWSCK